MYLNHLVCKCGRCAPNSNKKVFKAFPRNVPTMTSFLMTSLTCSATDWTSAAATLASLSGWSKDPPLSFEIPMAALAAEKWFIVVGQLEAILDFFSLPFLPTFILSDLLCLSFPHRLAFTSGTW